MNENGYSPCAILCATVDVGAVIQQVLDYGEPAAGACLVERAVTGVVSVIHLTYSVLQTVQHHLLKRANTEGERGLMSEIVCVCVRECVCTDVCVAETQAIQDQTHKSDSADTNANSPFLYSSCGREIRKRRNRVCSCAKQTHALIHKRSIILELAPRHIDETKCDSTVFSVPDSCTY